MSDREARLAELERYHREEVAVCTRCPLAEGRTTVVLGSGRHDAEVMFVGEAPGYHEDQQGVPFVGRAGALLGDLLRGIGLERESVFIANVLKCRPPDNRDPRPEEIDSCEPHLFRQVALIRPLLVCTLGNFATRLLSGRPDGIGRVHGIELPLTIGGRRTLLYPLYHPAAALYARATLSTLQEDFARIPSLLAAERASSGGDRAAGPVKAEPEPETTTTDESPEGEVEIETSPAVGGSTPGAARPATEGDGAQMGLF